MFDEFEHTPKLSLKVYFALYIPITSVLIVIVPPSIVYENPTLSSVIITLFVSIVWSQYVIPSDNKFIVLLLPTKNLYFLSNETGSIGNIHL